MKRLTKMFLPGLASLVAACGGGSSSGSGTGGPSGPVGPGPGGSDVVTAPARPPAETFLELCRGGLVTATQILPTILSAPEPRTIANTLEPYNDLLIAISTSSNLASLHSEVNPDKAVQDAARTCEQEISAFMTDLGLSKPMFEALSKLDVKAADAETVRFHADTLRDYRRSGVDKDDATRARLEAIDEELTKLSQAFTQVLSEQVGSIAIDPKELAGLPEDYVAAHPVGADGKVKITTDYPDMVPFMTYAESDARRKELYVVDRTRGFESNPGTLGKILALRSEQAKLLGYANWADYITEDKMMKSGKAAGEFIDRIHGLAKARAKRDYDDLLRQLRLTDKKAKAVADWQKWRLEALVKRSKYQVNGEEVRQYFAFDLVLAGLLDITSTIYDIKYTPVKVTVWHPSVTAYDVTRGTTKLGRVFLDLHPRDNKYKHAAQFSMIDGVAGRQLPEGALICNFPEGLMEHEDVTTMFHEFGHLMHHVLGGNHHWIAQSGVSTEWDFAEAPSQMFEEWAWSYETLKRFAKHHETGEVIPEALVEKMRQADTFGRGTQTAQQMFYAALSLNYHRLDPAKLDQLTELKRLQAKYTPFAYVDGTQMQASFGHLVGYSAIYYTYLWSLVIAKDLLTPFQKHGLMDTSTTYAYRDKILAPGGTRDAADLVEDFLGRPFDFKAYEAYLAR